MTRPRLRRWARRAAAALALVVLAAALACLVPFPERGLRRSREAGAIVLMDREGRAISWRVGPDEQWRFPVPLDGISPWLRRATVVLEDRRFASHPGVDPIAASRALWQNAVSGRRVSGASTITMQVVRLLHPRPRTLAAKAVEAIDAVRLERLSGKDGVLGLYLNLAPYGGNVVGAEAAARRYFGKSAAHLTLGEAALLAGIPQSPVRFDPRRRLDAALRRRETVFRRLREEGSASEEEVRAARRNGIEEIRIADPVSDPADAAWSDFVLSNRFVSGIVRTTLDPRAQGIARDAVARHAAALGELGIDGAAVVAIDVASSNLLAMVGSADPGDPLRGQVNAAAARRQPGSLLKPFLYAAAFEVGFATPSSLVYDVPGAWGAYRPRNMDRSFRGPMSASRALTESRNLPAVRLLDRLGAERFARDLERLGIDVPPVRDRYGLSLALGASEVRLVDVANAYTALARLGMHRPLRLLENDPEGAETAVFSAPGAYLALRALGAARTGGSTTPVWKTGTSWNHRDAWAVVLTPDHVVAAWCGRMSGAGHPALVGASAALPLAREVHSRLEGACARTWDVPCGVALREVCAVSGEPRATACPAGAIAEYLPGISREAPCSIHRGASSPAAAWPPEVAREMGGAGFASACGEVAPLRILSPVDGGEYVPERDGCRMVLAAAASRGAGDLYWFLDGERVGLGPAAGAVRCVVPPGGHEVAVSDGEGRSARAVFTVLASR